MIINKITKEYIHDYTDKYLGIITVNSKDILDLLDHVEDLTAKLQYILSNFIISDEEGFFAFPDGDTWNCKSVNHEPHSQIPTNHPQTL
jgi:hypothetical protein